MTATATATVPAEIKLAARVQGAVKAASEAGDDKVRIGHYQQAVTLAERGARTYPDYRFPTTAAGTGSGPSFADVAGKLRAKLPTAAPEVAETVDRAQSPATDVKAPVRKATARKAAPRKAAPKKAAPVAESAPATVEALVLRLVHDGVNPTSIFGVPKGSPAHKALSGRHGGLGWGFWGDDASWYLRRSKGYAADMDAIGAATSALESIKGDAGEQLYRVESAISQTGPDGAPLPVRMSAEQAAAWQKRYDGRRNALSWDLSMGQAVCACGVTGLGEKTATLAKDSEGMPVAQCHNCTVAPAPVAAVLALPAAPSAETADCPLCHQQVKVTGGKLDPHSFRAGACRGRLGMVIEDDPIEDAPVRPARPRKTTAAPVVDASADATGLTVAVQFVDDKVSGQAMKDTATTVRRAVNTQITEARGAFKGVKFEIRREKATRQLIMTVVAGGAGVDVEALAKKITTVINSVNKVVPGSSRLAIA